MLPVTGISFNLIIIRVGRGTAIGSTYDSPTMGGAVIVQHVNDAPPGQSPRETLKGRLLGPPEDPEPKTTF